MSQLPIKRYYFFLSLFLSVILSFNTYAHIGSAGVVVQKQVGKYQVLVQVQPPDVVPGTAKVSVFVEQGRVSSVQGRPVYFFAGDEGAPTSDELPSIGTNRFAGDVWLMESGSSSIQLTLDGPDGKAEVVVPVMAIATATRDMPAGTGAGLAVMGLLLLVMMITIIGASNADGVGVISPRRRLVGMGIGGVILVLILTGGRSWWNSKADEYRTYQLYKPVPLITSAVPLNGQTVLTIQPDTTGFSENWNRKRDFNLLIPDHGKLMHAFIVRLDKVWTPSRTFTPNALIHCILRRDYLSYLVVVTCYLPTLFTVPATLKHSPTPSICPPSSNRPNKRLSSAQPTPTIVF